MTNTDTSFRFFFCFLNNTVYNVYHGEKKWQVLRYILSLVCLEKKRDNARCERAIVIYREKGRYRKRWASRRSTESNPGYIEAGSWKNVSCIVRDTCVYLKKRRKKPMRLYNILGDFFVRTRGDRSSGIKNFMTERSKSRNYRYNFQGIGGNEILVISYIDIYRVLINIG